MRIRQDTLGRNHESLGDAQTQTTGQNKTKDMAIVNLPPPNVTPQKQGLIEGLLSLNKALLNPYFWGGYVRGVR